MAALAEFALAIGAILLGAGLFLIALKRRTGRGPG